MNKKKYTLKDALRFIFNLTLASMIVLIFPLFVYFVLVKYCECPITGLHIYLPTIWALGIIGATFRVSISEDYF